MKNRSSLWMVILATTGVLIVFLLNLQDAFSGKGEKELLSSDDISGIAVVHERIPYTLGYSQQVHVIKMLNKAIPTMPPQNLEKFPFDRIIIYPFSGESIEITPLERRYDDLIFSSPKWNNSKPLRDTSAGKLLGLIESVYKTPKK